MQNTICRSLPKHGRYYVEPESVNFNGVFMG